MVKSLQSTSKRVYYDSIYRDKRCILMGWTLDVYMSTSSRAGWIGTRILRVSQLKRVEVEGEAAEA
jgi:hypothetical protein